MSVRRLVIEGDTTAVSRVVIEGGTTTVVAPVRINVVSAGITGPQGGPGPTGTTGATGPAGPVGPAGPASPGGADFYHVHVQDNPLATWTVPHMLNGYPQVAIVDNTDDQIEGDVSYVDANTVLVEFGTIITGKAFLS